VRVTLFWITIAALLFVVEVVSGSAPISGAPVLALALASYTRTKLQKNPLRRHLFGGLPGLQLSLPGLLYAAAAMALLLEQTEQASSGLAFLVGAAVATIAVLCMAVMLSAPPSGGDRVRYVCARCGLGSDRTSGREPCPHCGLFTRIEWGVELPESCEEGGPLTRVWCPKCGTERAAPRGTSACGNCGERLHIEFNDHATGASAAGDGRGLEAR